MHDKINSKCVNNNGEEQINNNTEHYHNKYISFPVQSISLGGEFCKSKEKNLCSCSTTLKSIDFISEVLNVQVQKVEKKY